MAAPASADTRASAEARFVERYGLAPQVVYETLGVEVLEDARAAHPAFADAPALKIPYRHPATNQPAVTWPGHPPFYRLRYLAERPRGGEFRDATRPDLPRYVQPPGSVNGLYFPATYPWRLVLDAPTYPVFVTEGEFKAAKASAEGFPTVAIGGVDLWRARNRVGLDELLPGFDLLDLIGRTVYLAFDSDWQTNQNVARNLNLLGEALRQRGAFPHLLLLPQSGDAKVGLDDFLLAEGPDGLRDLVLLASPLLAVKPLFELNERSVYVRDPGFVAHLSGQKQRPSEFTGHRHPGAVYDRTVEAGKVSPVRLNVSKAWLQWPLRRTVERLSYAPGQPRQFEERGDPVLNEWAGWGCAPAKGDVQLFLKLAQHLFSGTPAAQLTWFLRWLAYPLQVPGTKLLTSVMLHSPIEGNGKSLLGLSVKPIYGSNYGVIRQTDVDQRFTAWAVNKQFIQGDEVSSTRDKRTEVNFFKNLITQQEVVIDQKHLQPYSIPDRINYYWTSNHADPLFLSDRDRRFFIHRVDAEPLPREFYQRYLAWLWGPAGGPALFDYLLRLDLGDFDPGAPPPETEAKRAMVEHGHSDLARWVRLLLDDPDAVLRVGQVVRKRDLWTSTELAEFYNGAHSKPVSVNAMGCALSEANVQHVRGGQLRGTPAKGRSRFFAVRNAAKWLAPKVTVESTVAYLCKNWEK